MNETAFDLQAFIDQKGFWQDNPKASCKGVALVDAITHIEQLQAENERLKPKPLLFGNLHSFNVIISDQVPEGQIWFATQKQLDEALEYSQKQIEKLIKL